VCVCVYVYVCMCVCLCMYACVSLNKHPSPPTHLADPALDFKDSLVGRRAEVKKSVVQAVVLAHSGHQLPLLCSSFDFCFTTRAVDDADCMSVPIRIRHWYIATIEITVCLCPLGYDTGT